jgi:general secretion pathway protein A
MAETMSTNESLSLLFSVWGYEVDKGEAWCDQAYRGGMACLSGTETLETLLSDGLPWVATLEVDSASFPVVVIGEERTRLPCCQEIKHGSLIRHGSAMSGQGM